MSTFSLSSLSFFFFNDTPTTEIYTLSLHDALPISWPRAIDRRDTYARRSPAAGRAQYRSRYRARPAARSEEHTSELQSHVNLVCRLLLEKKKKKHRKSTTNTHNLNITN